MASPTTELPSTKRPSVKNITLCGNVITDGKHIVKNTIYQYSEEDTWQDVFDDLTDDDGVDFTLGKADTITVCLTHKLASPEIFYPDIAEPISVALNFDPNLKYHAQSLVYLLNFYEQLTLFLRARSMVTAHPPVKANYTALLSSFVHIFLLKAKQGAELRCVTSIEGEPTSAVPDLRLVNIGSMQDIERNFTVCVINVVEVKKTRRRGDSLEGCDICSAVWDDLLARHAGCLLLEYPNTQYASKDCDTKVIQGIICMEMQLIFTWLEVSDVHYADIKEGNVSEKMRDTPRGRSADIKEGNVSEKMTDTPRGRSGLISYTRPYDYLLKGDREQILEFLYRLGLQSEGKSTADIKN